MQIGGERHTAISWNGFSTFQFGTTGATEDLTPVRSPTAPTVSAGQTDKVNHLDSQPSLQVLTGKHFFNEKQWFFENNNSINQKPIT